jgi:hypothetical protein
VYVSFAAAIATTLAFMFADELPKWKRIALAVFTISLFLQFMLPVHPIIPFVLQIGLSLVILFYFKVRDYS